VKRVPVRVTAGSPSAPPEGWVALRPSACPCCVGRVALQVELVRLLRGQALRGVLIELADPGHLPAMLRSLREAPLAQYLRVEGPP
jgi:hypothetical protein